VTELRVLVAGAGLIGSEVTRAYKDRGAAVTCVDISESRLRTVSKQTGADVRVLDIMDTASLADLMGSSRPQIVVHSAGRFHGRGAQEARELVLDSVNGAGSLAVAAVRASVSRFVLVSSLAVYASAQPQGPVAETAATGGDNPYGLAKFATEQRVLTTCSGTGTTLVITRLAGVYGGCLGGGWLNATLQDLVATAMDERRVRIPAYLAGHECLYVTDAARGVLLAGDLGEAGAYNIGTGSATSIREISDAFSALGAHVAIDESYDTSLGWWLDISKASTQLGFAAATELADGLMKWSTEIIRKEV
jgi:nucleoside-diphosphate-sugar epimerase